MADRPILFSAPMIRALLDGRKTQTRRVLTSYCEEPPAFVERGIITALDDRERPYRWPRTHATGGRLWVREAHYLTDDGDQEAAVYVDDADEHRSAVLSMQADLHLSDAWAAPHLKLRPSIHMPRWASRLTLYVTDVRVERLQDISEEDARAEGVECDTDGWRDYQMPRTQCCADPASSYRTLWDSINGPGAWDANPWIAAYTFAVRAGNIDSLPLTLSAEIAAAEEGV